MVEILILIKIRGFAMNKGERAELKFIATLGCYLGKTVNLWSNQTSPVLVANVAVPLTGTNLSRSIGIYPQSINPATIAAMSDSQLASLCSDLKITKAGPYSKSDVFLNGAGYSIKYTDGAPPALINHTNRVGWEQAASHAGINISSLDLLIDDYWNKRINGFIKEDVANSNPNSPFSNHLSTLKPFLDYFCFEGSGKKVSDHPAQCIIEFSDPCDITTWKEFSKANYINTVWSNLVFSIRSKKGMPPNISSLDLAKRNSILKWSRDFQGGLRGALHVRFK